MECLVFCKYEFLQIGLRGYSLNHETVGSHRLRYWVVHQTFGFEVDWRFLVQYLVELLKFFIFSFFFEVGLNWDPRTQARWPIAPYLSFKFIGDYLGVLPPYQGPWSRSASLFLFVLDPFWQNPRSASLSFSNTGHSHRMCTDVSFSASHLLHEGVFALLILCSMYCRLICPVRIPTNILQCFLSSLLMNWTYLLVGPSRHNCLVPYFSQTFHSVCFLFSI